MKSSSRQIPCIFGLVLLAMAFAPKTAAAQAAVAPATPVKPLTVTANVGFVNASGNTDITTLSADQRLEYRPEGSAWLFTEFLAAVYGRTDGVTSADQLKGGARVDRFITTRLSAFAGATYERNRFAGISRRFEELVGLAFKVLEQPRDILSVEGGASFNQQRSTTGLDESFVAARAAAAYKHLFTETAFFQQLVEVLPNLELSDDLRINTETSLVAPLSERFAVKLAYAIRFDNLPEPGFGKSDRVFTSGLQISF